MRPISIVSNLKSYKTEQEANTWLNDFLEIKKDGVDITNKEIIICPPFTLLWLFKSFVNENNLPIKIGAQNISPFEEGAYTGEVNARQIKDYADFVLIGHSERRSNFNESDEILEKKVEISLRNGLTPIFLVQSGTTSIPNGVSAIAYEPVFAIGSSNPDTPQNADSVASSLNSKGNKYNILYGGSVTSQNVNSFTKMQNISGVLVGGASLDAKEFIQIIKNV